MYYLYFRAEIQITGNFTRSSAIADARDASCRWNLKILLNLHHSAGL